MKLLLCLDCLDVFNLKTKEKVCSCGKTKGRYVDKLNAEIEGNCEPIGFSNTSLSVAINLQNINNKENISREGIEFTAFIIPSSAKSIKRKTK